MAFNNHTTKHLLRAVTQRLQPYNGRRSVHLATQSTLYNNRTSLPITTITRQSCPALAARLSEVKDVHVRKRRRYSQHARSPYGQNSSQPTEHNDWEAVDGSTMLVKPRKARTKTTEGPRFAGKPIIATSKWSGQNTGDKDGRSLKRGMRNRDDVVDAGRLVAKENRALFLPREPEEWQVQKKALVQKFEGEGWNPRKKLSPDTIEGIRALHDQDPERYSTPTLSEHFKVSVEAIRRILKSKWRPTESQIQDRRERWARRHDRIWDQKSELGLRPKRTTDRRVETPDEFEENLRAKEMLDNARRA